MKKERLFDITELELNPNYVSPSDKRKWTIKFTKWCNEMYFKYGSLHGTFCCGYMTLCNYCSQKKCNACADCVESVKTFYKENDLEIPYKDYDFKGILEKIGDKIDYE